MTTFSDVIISDRLQQILNYLSPTISMHTSDHNKDREDQSNVEYHPLLVHLINNISSLYRRLQFHYCNASAELQSHL